MRDIPLLLLALNGGITLAQAPNVLHHWWRADENVNAVAMDEANGRVVIGGAFRYVGPPQNYLSALDATTGAPAPGIAHPDRAVRCAVPDGQGGWFIGGDFSEVGGISRQRLAHIDATGQVLPWVAIASGTVTHMCLDGNVLYVGGSFNQLNLNTRNGLGALNASTGALLPWAPILTGGSGSLYAMHAHNGAVYLSGTFDLVNGEPRPDLAAVDANGALLPWAPGVTGFVSCLRAVGDTVLAAGYFTQIGGAPRQNIAALDAITGVPTAWAPAVNGSSADMLIADGTVYLAGAFTQVGGQPRLCFAQVDLATGEPTGWAPQITSGGSGKALARSGDTIYLGGTFKRINGQDRFNLAAVDAVTGALTSWAPGANNQVSCIGTIGDRVFAAGSFTSTGGVARAGLAALDLTTGAATDWAPYTPLYSTINALAVNGDIVHIGGDFDSLAHAPRRNIGAVDGATGAATPWAPEANSVVQRLALHGDRLYAGGVFDSIGGQAQAHVAALNLTTGESAGWSPVVNDPVRAFAFVGDTVFIGGSFTTVNGDAHRRLAAVSAATGGTLDWDALVQPSNSEVLDLLLRDDVLYIGGFFATMGGQPRGGLAAVQRPSGTLTDWDPSGSGNGWCLLYSNGSVIAGGDVSPQETYPFDRQLITTDTEFGLLNDWSMNFGGRVASMAGSPQVTCIAGMSTNVYIEGEPVQYFAALALPISTEAPEEAPLTLGQLSLAPNPTNGGMRVATMQAGAAELRVIDVHGAVVMRTPFAPAVDLARLPAGTYTVVLLDRSGIALARARVVKQ